MKIGIEAERANSRKKTGVEHYAQQLILQFAEIDKDNEFILYLRTEPEEWIKQLPKNFSYKVMPFPIFWTQIRLSIELFLHPVDCLFVPASAIPLYSAKNSVCTIHDAAFLFYPETFTWFMRQFLHWSYKYIGRSARMIIVPSRATKNDLVKFYKIDEKKIVVIHHGYTSQVVIPMNIGVQNSNANDHKEIDLGFGSRDKLGMTQPSILNPAFSVIPAYEPESRFLVLDAGSPYRGTGQAPSGMTQRGGINLPEKFVLFLSTLQPRKNLEGLIVAFRLFKQDHPSDPHKLVVAGKVGWKAERILRVIEEYKDVVVYLNHVSDSDRTLLYQKASALCVPSFYEGFGMWILEAFDAGVPVITSNISSMPEVGGDACEYCDPHSTESIEKAMASVLLDPPHAEELVRRGAERLKMFSWHKCAEETLQELSGFPQI